MKKYAVRCVTHACCGKLTAEDHCAGNLVAFADANGMKTYEPVPFDTEEQANAVKSKATSSQFKFDVIEFDASEWETEP